MRGGDYWIFQGQVHWASEWPRERITAARERDRLDAEIYAHRASRWGMVRGYASDLRIKVIRQIQKWLRR
jgi:hypothetical protein